MLHCSYDGHPRRFSVEADVPAYRVLARPIGPSQRFINYGNQLRLRPVSRFEDPSAHDRDAQGGEVVWRDEANVAVRPGIVGGL